VTIEIEQVECIEDGLSRSSLATMTGERSLQGSEVGVSVFA
jgi:hypothetical protein